MFFRKPKLGKKRKSYLPMGLLPSRMECPGCGSKLKLQAAIAAAQIYVCTKCGYRGSVGLEPGKIKLDKKMKI